MKEVKTAAAEEIETEGTSDREQREGDSERQRAQKRVVGGREKVQEPLPPYFVNKSDLQDKRCTTF